MNRTIQRVGIAVSVAAWGWAGVALAADDPKHKPADQTAQGQSDQQRVKQTFSVRRLSDLPSSNIKNHSDEDLGRITAVVVDTGRNRIAYAVLSFGGVLGVGDKEFAVPWSALEARIYPKNYSKIAYKLDCDKSKLEQAKGFDKNTWPNMSDRAWATEVHTFWGQKPYWEIDDDMESSDKAGRVNVDVDVNRDRGEVKTEVETSKDRKEHADRDKMHEQSLRQRSGGILVRGDQLVGHDLLDQSGKDFADLEAVMVDPKSGKLVYGIVQVDEDPDLAKDYMKPVPFSMINIQRVTPGGQAGDETNATARNDRDAVQGSVFLKDADAFKVVFSGTRDELNKGPQFPERDWPIMDQAWGKQVYEAYGMKPFWLTSAYDPHPDFEPSDR